jgi:hypothetical protein
MRMLDQAVGMESRRIEERIIGVRDAIAGMSDGRSAAELADPPVGRASRPGRARQIVMIARLSRNRRRPG